MQIDQQKGFMVTVTGTSQHKWDKAKRAIRAGEHNRTGHCRICSLESEKGTEVSSLELWGGCGSTQVLHSCKRNQFWTVGCLHSHLQEQDVDSCSVLSIFGGLLFLSRVLEQQEAVFMIPVIVWITDSYWESPDSHLHQLLLTQLPEPELELEEFCCSPHPPQQHIISSQFLHLKPNVPNLLLLSPQLFWYSFFFFHTTVLQLQ